MTTRRPRPFHCTVHLPHRRPGAVALGWALCALLLGPGAPEAAAQVSPGPLSSPHRHLEGIANCTRCHEIGHGVGASRCLQCHEPLKHRIDAGKGYHPRALRQSGGKCATCHHEHVARDFPLIDWPNRNREAFPHEQTGWALEGAHRKLECAKCHEPKRIHDEAVRRHKARHGALDRTYLGLETACTACHDDPHKGELGRDCASCHTQERFKPASRFDHDKTDFALAGAHAKLACAKCHRLPDAPPDLKGLAAWRFKPLAHGRCLDCHEDRHAGRMGSECRACHDERAFKPARFELAKHDATGFPLRHRHAEVRCEACHDKRLARKVAGAACASCHEDTAHRGALGNDCASCHTDRAWRPSTYVRARHAPERFALRGAHTQARCERCHADLVDGGALAHDAHPKAVAAPSKPIRATQLPLARAASAPTPQHASKPPRACARCHRDAHQGRFGRDCAQCHDSARWGPSHGFDVAAHARTRYPLEGAHAKLACTACHGEGTNGALARTRPIAFGRCTDCHEDAHHGELRHRADRGACESCHTVHRFRPSTFKRADHARLAFKLSGKHRSVECDGCHRPDGKSLTLKPRSTYCSDCHTDPHRGQLADANRRPRCAQCHDTRDWKARGFDHAQTRFPLHGAHAGLDCTRCHEPPSAGAKLASAHFRPLGTDCRSCHRDPHLGQFLAGSPRRACTACHDERRFRPAGRFDHNRMTPFSLDGAHARARCAQCHDTVEIAPGLEVVRYRATPNRCAACHADEHERAPWRRKGGEPK